MTVADTLMQAYRMDLHEALMITMPQLIMLNAGATCNKQRMDNRLERDKANGGSGSISTDIANAGEAVVFNGKRIEEMNSEEYKIYMMSGAMS